MTESACVVETLPRQGSVPPDRGSFVCESEAYALIGRSELAPPRHSRTGDASRFKKGEQVVLKGLGEDVWHKSELGAVQFMAFDRADILREAAAMRERIQKAGHRWLGALVCEHIDIVRVGWLPTELLVSLSRTEAGWVVVLGAGGMSADTLGAHVAPLLWPVDAVSPVVAFSELEEHFLGRVLLGTGRGFTAVTSREKLKAMIDSIWKLAGIAEADGLNLLEMNPVAFDADGDARPLDAVGLRGARAPSRVAPPAGFIECLLSTRSVAIAGVSATPGGVGRTILDNIMRCPSLRGHIVILKPGAKNLLGFPCIRGVSALTTDPVDLLLLAIPAPAAVEVVEKLIAQGGGARVVGMVAGGIGDGADRLGFGARLSALLSDARRQGRWTPAIVGPNSMGHWVPGRGLDTTFIPREKLPEARDAGGSLALLSQSGAFLLCRRSRHHGRGLLIGAALGNQMDVSLPDVLDALVPVADCRSVAAYVEGFQPGQLAATVCAARKLAARGVRIVIHRAGRTTAGRMAAASHTGALLTGNADQLMFERALLTRAGVRFSETVADFDAAIQWLAAFPKIRPGPVAMISNAGFECVTGTDALATKDGKATGFRTATLTHATTSELERMIMAEGLGGIVNPQLPLDLTPMARESACLRAAEILARGAAETLVVGLVPFTPRLNTGGEARLSAAAFASVAKTCGKPIGIVIDAGEVFAEFRSAFVEQGLPVFDRFEDAIRGLRTIG
ncbi:MAG TPA: CoA-binding protein [Opitutaceae bacterium]|nr:CoA-binding protein [Opitutaceae bacterium]